MNWQVAKNNWTNFLRMMVGLPVRYPVRIVRSEEAKKYPLLGIKKSGDVGYDLPAVERVVIPAATPEAIKRYDTLVSIANSLAEGERRDSMVAQALSYLPKAVIATGVRIQMPENIWASIEARSSSSSKFLITPDSIIDAGYTGQMFMVVFNIGYEPYTVEQGDRLVQVIFHQRVLAKFEEVDELGETERGETGFGSTGRGEKA